MIKCLPVFYTILLSSLKASLFLSLYYLLGKLNISLNSSDINSIYILNLLIILIISFKIYVGYLNYKNIFDCIFNIYKFTKHFYISYCTIINYKYIEEDIYVSDCEIHDYTSGNYESRGISYLGDKYDDEEYEEYEDNLSYIDKSFNDLSMSKNKKINLLYTKEILIIYISHTIYMYTEIFTNSSFFRESKKINEFIFNEVQKDHYDFNYNSKELHSNYIELLILKNLNHLKINNYITPSDYSILYSSFSNLQNYISKLQALSFKNTKISYLNYIMNCILVLNLSNIVLYNIKNNNCFNCQYFNGFLIFVISFIVYLINDISMIFINIFKNLHNIFDCESYIYNHNDELFLLNYFYLKNIEYKI